MRRVSIGTIMLLVIAGMIFATVTLSAQNSGHTDTKKLKNPVKSTPESIAAGKVLYAKSCTFCHGSTGKGDGPVAASTKGTKPSNIADDKWDHGSTDGEIFTNIKDGIGPKFEMKASKGKIADQDIWHLVNYVRSLGPAATTK